MADCRKHRWRTWETIFTLVLVSLPTSIARKKRLDFKDYELYDDFKYRPDRKEYDFDYQSGSVPGYPFDPSTYPTSTYSSYSTQTLYDPVPPPPVPQPAAFGHPFYQQGYPSAPSIYGYNSQPPWWQNGQQQEPLDPYLLLPAPLPPRHKFKAASKGDHKKGSLLKRVMSSPKVLIPLGIVSLAFLFPSLVSADSERSNSPRNQLASLLELLGPRNPQLQETLYRLFNVLPSLYGQDIDVSLIRVLLNEITTPTNNSLAEDTSGDDRGARDVSVASPIPLSSAETSHVALHEAKPSETTEITETSETFETSADGLVVDVDAKL